jgi:hypothetical protein
VLSTLAVDSFALPGDAGFPLNSLYHAPGSRADAGESPLLETAPLYSTDRTIAPVYLKFDQCQIGS